MLPDPIRWVSYLIKAMTGDDDEREKAKEDLTDSILGSVPFASNIAGLLGVEDIGRIPISNAMPNVSNLVKLKDKDVNSEYKKEIALKELSKPLLYLGLPVGGAQINKTIQGIATVNAGGSYKTNSKGEKQLQFPVENKSALKYIQAGVFGKNALPDAKAYADRGYKPLTAKQTEGYKKVQIPYREFLDYIDNNKQKKKEEKIEYINNMNLNENKQWNMYTYDIFSSTEREKDGDSQLKDAEYAVKNGVTKKEYIEIYNKAIEKNLDMPTQTEYKELKEQGISLNTYIDYKIKVKDFSNDSDEEIKTKDKLDILINSKYSSKEKASIYKEHILTNDTAKEKFELMEKTGITNSRYIDEYFKYLQQEFESDVKDNGTTKGKSVGGSAKKKVYEYVNNMNITYEQRLLLLGTQYKLTDTERTKVYNYVKSLNYTQDEMQKVFESLKGFTVYKDGRVTW